MQICQQMTSCHGDVNIFQKKTKNQSVGAGDLHVLICYLKHAPEQDRRAACYLVKVVFRVKLKVPR